MEGAIGNGSDERGPTGISIAGAPPVAAQFQGSGLAAGETEHASADSATAPSLDLQLRYRVGVLGYEPITLDPTSLMCNTV